MKIYIATKNAKKLVELKRILEPMGFEVLCQKDLDFEVPDVEETGTTFEENALLKAHSGLEATGYISVAMIRVFVLTISAAPPESFLQDIRVRMQPMKRIMPSF